MNFFNKGGSMLFSNKKTMRQVIIFLCIAMMLTISFAKNAIAASTYCDTTPAFPIMENVPPLVVDSTLANGSVIPGSEKKVSVTGNCRGTNNGTSVPGDLLEACSYAGAQDVPGMPGVYTTGISGVGMALINDNGDKILNALTANCDSRGTPVGVLDSNLDFSFSVTLQLIKIGDVASGQLSAQNTAWGFGNAFKAPLGNNSPNNTVGYGGQIIFRPITCNIKSDINVIMPKISKNIFNGVGSTSSEVKFSIPMVCNQDANVSLKLTGSYEDKDNGVLSLIDTADSAKGVGIQVLFNDAPVIFDNSFPVGALNANETFNIGLSSRYYQTQETITSGSVSAVAMFSITYN